VFKKTDRFFMMSMTNPCAECPEITDGLISTGKSDTMNHGFGLKNIRDASETYGGELSLSCEERSHVCKFRTEIIFNLPDEVTSDAPNLCFYDFGARGVDLPMRFDVLSPQKITNKEEHR